MSGLLQNLRRLLSRALPGGRRASRSRRRRQQGTTQGGGVKRVSSPRAGHRTTPTSSNNSSTPSGSGKTTPSRGAAAPSLLEESLFTATPSDRTRSPNSSGYTTSQSSYNSSPAPPPPLPSATHAALRTAVLTVLSEEGVLSAEHAAQAAAAPPLALDPRFPGSLRLWLPDATLTACFVDFVNVRLRDPDLLRQLLRTRVRVANCDVDTLQAVLDESSVVGDLVRCRFQEDSEPAPGAAGDGSNNGAVSVFYSFCLGRAVQLQEFQHCSRCNMCYDWRYWHCSRCDCCSLGLSLGRCDHCGAYDRDLLALNASPGSRRQLDVNLEGEEKQQQQQGAERFASGDNNNTMLGEPTCCYLSLPRRERKMSVEKSVDTVSQLIYASSEIETGFCPKEERN